MVGHSYCSRCLASTYHVPCPRNRVSVPAQAAGVMLTDAAPCCPGGCYQGPWVAPILIMGDTGLLSPTREALCSWTSWIEMSALQPKILLAHTSYLPFLLHVAQACCKVHMVPSELSPGPFWCSLQAFPPACHRIPSEGCLHSLYFISGPRRVMLQA